MTDTSRRSSSSMALIMTVKQSNQFDRSMFIFSVIIFSLFLDLGRASQPVHPHDRECALYENVSENELGLNEILVKSPSGQVACIKASFSLSIKVETKEENALPPEDGSTRMNVSITPDGERRVTLGYLPLDKISKVQDSCPEPLDANSTDVSDYDKLNQLEMIVSFTCGKLSFTVNRTESHYQVSSIGGIVNLDPYNAKEFRYEKPVFLTSDLKHYYSYQHLIQLPSEAETKSFILTAKFYNMDLEAFRFTNSQTFTRPPDPNSRPFPE